MKCSCEGSGVEGWQGYLDNAVGDARLAQEKAQQRSKVGRAERGSIVDSQCQYLRNIAARKCITSAGGRLQRITKCAKG